MENLISVMPTFNPDSEVLNNIRINLQQLDRLIIVDDGSSYTEILDTLSDPKILLIKLEANQGIAKALNVGISRALSDGAQYVLFLDQDSRIGPSHISELIKIFNKYKAINNVGITVPGMIDNQKSLPRRYLDEYVGVVPEAIQSGMVVHRDCFESIGLMDESLFIDCVDTEFCERATKHNILIAAALGVNLEHSLGNLEKLNFFGIQIKRRGLNVMFNSHNAFRSYYITRNNIDLLFRYLLSSPRNTLRRAKAELIQSFFTVASGPRRFKQLLAIFCGVYHGLIRRRGKISNSVLRLIQ